MIRSVLFVTTELSPLTAGGAGVLVADLSRRLAAAGVDVQILLAADIEPAHPPPGVHVLRAAPPDTAAGFRDRSGAIAREVARMVAEHPRDLIEFHDFDGIGFEALTHRHDLGLESSAVAVRFHGPVDLQVAATGVAPPELEPVREMERSAYGLADLVIAPSPAVGRLIAQRYGVDRLAVGWPPIAELQPVPLTPAASPEFAVVGRLGEVKGSHDIVEAALPLLREHPRAVVRFIGGDGWSASAGQPMQTWLESLIPDDLRERIVFAGPVRRDLLPAHLATAWAVVAPSRFESFCLAAHEARRLGLPIIVPDLPAFEDTMSEESGALVYDGTVAGLRRVMARIAAEPDLRDTLGRAAAPVLGDPLDPYRLGPPRPRHPQAQAGMATAAVNRWEAAMRAIEPDASPLAGPARRLLRYLPEPLARFAVRIVPRALKDRFRSVASWPEERARRERVTRQEEIEQLIAAGAFAEAGAPVISVVIPVYNDAEYLREALVSVFASSRSGEVAFEVIVVDDGSSDPATIAAIDAIDWPRVRIIRHANRGLPGARNAGIDAARGELIVPLDSDDMLAPEYLTEMAAALEQHPEAAYIHCWAALFGDIERLWQTRPFNPYQLLLSNSVVGCVMMRRSAWEAVGGYDETMRNGNEDWELWVRLLEAGYTQVQLPKALFQYRKHGTSMSVETEARFEEGRREIAARHPQLYTRDQLRALKRAHYPLVSVIVADPGATDFGDGADIEIVDRGPSLASAVLASHGKYIVEWDGVTAERGALEALAHHLEGLPEVAAVRPAGSAGPLLWRRWVVVDAEATPEGTVTAEAEASGPPGDLTRGLIEDPLWKPLHGVFPVQRQRPEEDGYLPDWIPA